MPAVVPIQIGTIDVEATGQTWVYPVDVFLTNLSRRAGDQNAQLVARRAREQSVELAEVSNAGVIGLARHGGEERARVAPPASVRALVVGDQGARELLDVVAPAQQGQLPDADSFVEDGIFAHHQLTAWDPRGGALLPAFPRVMDDMQFIGSPAIADVDGDGVADVVNGSGAYLVRAYTASGATPAGWPKFTHGWHLSSPTPGDVDGDGQIEIVAVTREGNLFVWDTPAPATEAALAECDLAFVLTTRDVVRLLATQRFIKRLAEWDVVPDRIKVLVNSAEVGAEISDGEIESILEHPVAAYLPSNPEPATYSINSGKPLTISDPKQPLAVVLTKLAELTFNRWSNMGRKAPDKASGRLSKAAAGPGGGWGAARQGQR